MAKACITAFLDTEFLGDHSELDFQNFSNAVLDRVLEHEVERPHDMRLTDAVDAANALFDSHRIPRHIEVDDYVAELKVQTLATGVRRDQYAHVARECLLRLGACVEIHAAVQSGDGKAPALKEFRQHRLRRNELSEHKKLQRRLVLLLLQLVDQLEQRFGLRIRTLALGRTRELQQRVDLGFFHLPALRLHGDIHLSLAVEFSPFLDVDRIKQRGLDLRLIEESLPFLKRGPDGRRAGCHQALHQDHQEADMALLRRHSLVVAVAHIIGDGFIEPLLSGMAILPCNGVKPGHPRLKEWLTFRIDRGALFGANYEGAHPVAVDAVFIGEGIPINQLHQPHELVGFALMWGGGKEQQIGRGLCQRRAQLVASHLFRAAAHAVRLVDNNEVPGRRNEILEPLPVVGAELLYAPAAPAFKRFHRIQRADYLVMQTPEVLLIVPPLPERRQLRRLDELQRFAEV